MRHRSHRGLLPLAVFTTLPFFNTSLAAPSSSFRSSSTAQQQPTDAKSADRKQEAQSKDLAAQADETKPATLEAVVVSAERGVPLRYAGGRDIIEPEVKAKYADGGVEALLRRVPGVYMLPENNNDSRIHIGLRGNDPRRSALTALLVDGIPICEAPYGNTDVDGLPIAFDRIWRMDVIRGGASIRYGPNSAGGIVNLLTEPVPESNLLRVGGRIGSNGEYAESIATGGTYGCYGVLVSGVDKGGDGFRDNSDYRDLDGAVKVRARLSERDSLQAYVSRFTELGAEQPGGLTQAAFDADPDQSLRPGSDFTFTMNRYVMQFSHATEDGGVFEFRSWYQDGLRRLNDFRPIVGPFTLTRQQNSDFHSGALEASYSWSTNWLGMKHTFFHSARFLQEENDELYVRAPIGGGPIVTPHELDILARADAFAAFTEDVISLTPNLDWGIGLRSEMLTMRGHARETDRDLVQDYTVLLPETSLTWTVLEDTALYASYQEGFYPPQYETGFDPASTLFAPTQPESSEAFEVGARTCEVSGLEATVALFDTEFHDKIDFINTPTGKVPVNSGHARSRGIEVGLDYEIGSLADSFDGLMVYGSVTALRSTIESGVNDGNDTPRAPHLLASWGTEYDHRPTGLWARFGGSYSGDQYSDPVNTPVGTADGINGPTPSFTLWDCAVGWSQRPDRSGFSIVVGMTNLLDEEYFRRFATGIYPGAPRQSFAALTYSVSL